MLGDEAQANLDAALEVVRTGRPAALSGSFGAGWTERCIETPWTAQWLTGGERLLDVGYSLSSLDYLGLLLALRRERDVVVDGLDIIEPARVAGRYPDDWRSEALSVDVRIGDVRTVDLPRAAYDVVTCISTLEHVGFDAPAPDDPESAFDRPTARDAAPRERDPATTAAVLRQFHHAVRPGGLVLVTVPLGDEQPVVLRDSLGRYAVYWEYGPAGWDEIARAPGYDVVEECFFRRDADDGTWSEVGGPDELVGMPPVEVPHARGVGLVALRSA